jgi:hypothetical protein
VVCSLEDFGYCFGEAVLLGDESVLFIYLLNVWSELYANSNMFGLGR